MVLHLKRLYSSPYTRLGLGLLLSAVALYLAVRAVDFTAAGQALRAADWRFVSLALLSVALNTLAKAARWLVLFGPAAAQVGLWKSTQSLLVGQMLNTLFPARLGELSRAYTVGGLGPGRAFTLGTLAVEKMLDLLAYALLFVYLLVLFPLPGWVGGSGYGLAVASVLIALVIFLLAYRRETFLRLFDRLLVYLPERVSAFAARSIAPRLRAGLDSLSVIQSPLALLYLSLWSAFIWATAMLNNHLTLLALDLHLPLAASLLVLIGLQVGISIPAVPGRFGIFEYICVLALGVFGVPETLAFTYGLLLHAIVLLPTTLLGVLFFWTLGLDGRGLPSPPERPPGP